MRSKALLLITTATAIRPTTRRAALGAITTVPTAAVAYDAATYDRYASSYDDLDGGQAAKALGIAAARRNLAEKCAGRVLEVGAGTGLQAPFYAGNRDIKEVTFVDASRGMLDGLRAKLSSAPLPFKTEVVEADAARLPSKSETYDVVVDTFGLCVYDAPVAVLRELGRVVKPAGRILLLENARPSNALLGAYLCGNQPVRKHVEGVGRQKVDFQTGAYVDATAGFVAKNGGKGCRYDQDVEALARAAGLRVVRSERFGGGFFGSFELAPAPR